MYILWVKLNSLTCKNGEPNPKSDAGKYVGTEKIKITTAAITPLIIVG